MWCRDSHQVEPDPAEMAARYGAGTTVLDWRERLICSCCASRQVEYSGERDEAAPRVDGTPTPPLVNRSAGVVTPMTPNAVIVAR